MDARRQFDPDPRILADVRLFVSASGLVDLQHPAVVVASELASNAIRHAGSPFTVGVQRLGSAIRLEVADRSRDLPAPRTDGAGIGGYGLRVVEALSLAWGVAEGREGKTVWAEVDVTPA